MIRAGGGRSEFGFITAEAQRTRSKEFLIRKSSDSVISVSLRWIRFENNTAAARRAPRRIFDRKTSGCAALRTQRLCGEKESRYLPTGGRRGREKCLEKHGFECG
jgi:hypothetical protein